MKEKTVCRKGRETDGPEGTAGSTAEGKAHRAAGDLCKGLARHGRRVVPVGGKGARHGGGHEARRGHLEAIHCHRGAEDPEIPRASGAAGAGRTGGGAPVPPLREYQ